MRALSLSQPWLHAVLHFGKHVENRKWRPAARMLGERIALHAAKSWDKDGAPFLESLGFTVPPRPMLATSAIVGVATIDRVVDAESAEKLPPDQRRWFFGPFGWILRNVIVLNDPIVNIGGALGLWRLDAHDAFELTARLKVESITGPRVQCCPRDDDYDGNCPVHAAPGVMRGQR